MATERVMIIDGMSANDWPASTQFDFMKQLAGIHDVDVARKRIRSRSGLKRALDEVRWNSYQGIHFIGHGDTHFDEPGIMVGNKFVALDDPVFADLGADWILLSSCFGGDDPRALRALMRSSGSRAVIGYPGLVQEYQAFVVDALIYNMVMLKRLPDGHHRSDLSWRQIGARINRAAAACFLNRESAKTVTVVEAA